MKICLIVLVILLPLGVMAAPAGHISLSIPVLSAQWSALPVNSSPASQAVHQCFLKDRVPTLILAHSAADSPGKSEGGPDDDIDLREVDWDKVKAGKKGKDVKNGDDKDNGDKDEENGDDEKDDKKDDEEKGEGGGWDRLWDCPKLG